MARSESSRAWAVGGTTFAACMMVMVGAWQVLVGIAALAQDEIFVTGPEYIYQFDLTGWGTVHVVVGALVLLTGIFVFTGQAWARAVGIGLVILSATAQFFWMPWQPLWSMVMIAVDVFVVWALVTVQSDAPVQRGQDEEYAGRTTGSWSNLNTGPETSAPNPSREMNDAQARMEAESPAAGRPEQRPSDET